MPSSLSERAHETNCQLTSTKDPHSGRGGEGLPVEPRQEALGRPDELHHAGEEVVGGLAGDATLVGHALPALRGGHVQAVGGRPHPHHQGLQVVRLHPVVLKKKPNKNTTAKFRERERERRYRSWIGASSPSSSSLSTDECTL